MSVDLPSLLSLPRPEYAKQTEMVVVDLLWNSVGTALGEADALLVLKDARIDGRANRRIVLEASPSAKRNQLTETRAWAEGSIASGVFGTAAHASTFAASALNSVKAPQSRRDRSVTCVPVHAGIVPFQTLNGAVNKRQPPDLAKAVEVMSGFGGAARTGEAGYLLAHALRPRERPTEADMFFAAAGANVWKHLGQGQDGPLPIWSPDLTSGVSLESAPEGLGGVCPHGPAAWFWQSWTTLLDPLSGWRDALPDRRFSDWATCILRTGLAMTYLWEAAVFRAMRDFLVSGADADWLRLREAFREPRLMTIARREATAEERNIASILEEGLGDAYHARTSIKNTIEGCPGERFELDLDLDSASAFASLPGLAEAMAESARVDPKTAPKSMKEFVRYLLLKRAADDSASDEVDLYFLARTRGKHTWVEPGPEWLVVVASLAARRPGGSCTLQDVAAAFRKLGIAVDRATLVGLLEGAGLTQDSPDADEAIIVNAGF